MNRSRAVLRKLLTRFRIVAYSLLFDYYPRAKCRERAMEDCGLCLGCFRQSTSSRGVGE